MQSKMIFKVIILALLLSAMLSVGSGAATISDPLCSGEAGIPTCSSAGITTGFSSVVSCSNWQTPTCSPADGNPICSGFPSKPVCSVSRSTPQCPYSPGFIDPSSVIFSGHSGAAQSILTISLLIMLVMSFVIAIVYSIGYAFRLDKLLRFAKSEIGEIILTLLIVLMFIGAFTVMSASIGPNNFFAAGSGALNNNVFMSDCSMLAQESFDLIKPLFEFGALSLKLMFIGSLSVSLAPNYFGPGFNPLSGISALSPVINTLMFGTGIFTVILIGVTAFIVIIYALFPLFLYLGIILRTLPWTRPAGGAFLGMFIAFYIMFPLLIYYLLVGYVPYLSAPGLSIQPNPTDTGSTITATCLSSLDHCRILVSNAKDGTKVVMTPDTWTGTVKYNTWTGIASSGIPSSDLSLSPLIDGCYNVAANDIATGRSAFQALTVGSATTPCQSQVDFTQIPNALSGQSSNFNFGSVTSALTLLVSLLFNLNPYPPPPGNPPGLINGYVYDVLEPVLYTLFTVVLSLIISFDFMEAMGDLLGAPSLRSQNMLKRVL